MRCGEQRPICSACERLNLDCAYLCDVGERRESSLLPDSHGRQALGRPARSRYLIRFVDCNKTIRTQARETAHSPAGSRQKRHDSADTAMLGVLSPPDEEATQAASIMDREPEHSGHASPSRSIESHHTELSTLIPESQGHGPVMMPTAIATTPAAEAGPQSFFNGMDTELMADISMQFFDSPGQTLPLDRILDASAEYDQHRDLCFPDLSTRHTYVDDQLSHNPLPQPLRAEASPIPANSKRDNSVKISDGDHGLIQHFLTAMRHFSAKLLLNSEEDLNCLTFSNLGLFNAQLFHAMMAFAAIHRAQTQDSFFTQAELRYQRATALLFEDDDAHNHLDVTILTVWFLLQYELLFASGTVRFCNLLTHLARTLDGYSGRNLANAGNLSKLGVRTLVWLSAYDVRAVTSGGRGGYFLRSIENFLPLRVHLEEPASTLHGGPLAPLFVSIPTSSHLDHTAVLRLRLRSNILHERIFKLSQPERSPGAGGPPASADDAEWDAVRNCLIEQHQLFEISPVLGFTIQVAIGTVARLNGSLSSLRFSHLLSLSSLYAACLDYHHLVRTIGLHRESPLANTSSATSIPSREECSARMVRIAWFVCQNRRLSPHTVWPSLLLVAGIDSMDGVHREWVLHTLKQTETWSTHFFQTRVLLEAIYKQQSKLQAGEVVDVLKVQMETTGPFIL